MLRGYRVACAEESPYKAACFDRIDNQIQEFTENKKKKGYFSICAGESLTIVTRIVEKSLPAEVSSKVFLGSGI